jgi:hypothetical protein
MAMPSTLRHDLTVPVVAFPPLPFSNTPPTHTHTRALQAFSADALAALTAAKVVDEGALSAMFALLGQPDAEPATKPSNAWIAGPVVGGVAGAAILIGAVWLLVRRKRSAPGTADAAVAAPAAAAVPVDAGTRVTRRGAAKYAVSTPAAAEGSAAEGASSDGETPRSGAQVRRRDCLRCSLSCKAQHLHPDCALHLPLLLPPLVITCLTGRGRRLPHVPALRCPRPTAPLLARGCRPESVW